MGVLSRLNRKLRLKAISAAVANGATGDISSSIDRIFIEVQTIDDVKEDVKKFENQRLTNAAKVLNNELVDSFEAKKKIWYTPEFKEYFRTGGPITNPLTKKERLELLTNGNGGAAEAAYEYSVIRNLLNTGR